jgi:hypothetical protein
VWAGRGGNIDDAATNVTDGYHRGNTHVEECVGLALRVHAGKAVDESGNKKLAGAVDDLRAFGDGDGHT